MFGLENRGEILIFMSRHFEYPNDHFDFAFSPFWCTKIITGDYFVLRINEIMYSKQIIGCFIYFSISPTLFLQQFFNIHFVQGGVQMAYG